MNVPTIALTPEQAALTPIYREKWRQIGLSIAPVDSPIATATINTVYHIIGLDEPEIIFQGFRMFRGVRGTTRAGG